MAYERETEKSKVYIDYTVVLLLFSASYPDSMFWSLWRNSKTASRDMRIQNLKNKMLANKAWLLPNGFVLALTDRRSRRTRSRQAVVRMWTPVFGIRPDCRSVVSERWQVLPLSMEESQAHFDDSQAPFDSMAPIDTMEDSQAPFNSMVPASPCALPAPGTLELTWT